MSTILVNPGQSAKIQEAQPGDTVALNVPGERVNLKNGQAANRITYMGVAGGVNFPGGAVGITCNKLKSHTTSGNAFQIPGDWADCSITNCDISWKGRTTGVAVGGKTTRVKVDGNWFHNSDRNSYRDLDVHSTEDFSYSRNRFYRTGYAAHMNGKHVRLRVVGNTSFQTWQVRGIEIQDEGHYMSDTGTDILYADNVICDCLSPDVDTFGASIPPQGCTNVRVEDCYFSVYGIGKTEPTDGWGNLRDPGRKYQTGFGLETGGAGIFWVRRCVFVGPWVMAIVAMRKTHYENCTSYSLDADGKSMNQWGPWGTEGGNFGDDEIVAVGNNNRVLKLSEATPPWRTLAPDGTLSGKWADGTPVSGNPNPPPPPPPDPEPTVKISNVKAEPIAQAGSTVGNAVKVTWTATDAAAGETVNVTRFVKGSTGAFDKRDALVPVAATAGGYVDNTIPASSILSTWEYSYSVGSVASTPRTVQIGKPVGSTPPPPGEMNFDVISSTRNGLYAGTKVVKI